MLMVTYGEIRRLAGETGAGWVVDPGPADDVEVVVPSGLGPVPVEAFPMPGVEPADLAKLAERHPAAHPMLQARRTATGLPAGAVDWRDRWGHAWVTQVRDQGPCDAGLAFAFTAVIEGMVRIEHCVWCVRSEGDPHDGLGLRCADPGSVQDYGTWISRNGICDPACWPYTTTNAAYRPTPDRPGRTVLAPQGTWFGLIPADQKRWLDAYGPALALFPVYPDFAAYSSGVYRHTGGGPLLGSQALAIVGYDDGQGCWIARNSWGTSWGEGGYIRIGYGVLGFEQNGMYCLINPEPDPWTMRRTHNGGLLARGGPVRHTDFQLLAPAADHRMRLWTCDNETTPYRSWTSGPAFGAGDLAYVPTLTATTYRRDLECVHTTRSDRLRHWYHDPAAKVWRDGGAFGPTDAAGVPGFLQSNVGAPGDLEVVVRLGRSGQLQHWRRPAGGAWQVAATFAQHVKYSGASLVLTNIGTYGTLDVVCVLDTGRMEHWRRGDAPGGWQPLHVFAADVHGSPVMIENQSVTATATTVGDFHLCVPSRGTVQHWCLDNQSPTPTWSLRATFGEQVAEVLGLTESSFDFALQAVVLRTDGRFQQYVHQAGSWQAGKVFGPS
ncbi:C1 family peptidase [Kitasatospora cinereorecta]|uniref:C1 family peptidase n=1 Tax=Kitasatospora cinereorecta TaxID=285560 RepID=A0ABW0VNH0_9ACTN